MMGTEWVHIAWCAAAGRWHTTLHLFCGSHSFWLVLCIVPDAITYEHPSPTLQSAAQMCAPGMRPAPALPASSRVAMLSGRILIGGAQSTTHTHVAAPRRRGRFSRFTPAALANVTNYLDDRVRYQDDQSETSGGGQRDRAPQHHVLAGHSSSPPSRSTRRACRMTDPDAASWIAYPARDAVCSSRLPLRSVRAMRSCGVVPSAAARRSTSGSVKARCPLSLSERLARLIRAFAASAFCVSPFSRANSLICAATVSSDLVSICVD